MTEDFTTKELADALKDMMYERIENRRGFAVRPRAGKLVHIERDVWWNPEITDPKAIDNLKICPL